MRINIGNLISSAIEFKEISQKQAAIDLGIPYTTFNNYVNGTREPDFNTLVKIFRYLELDLNKTFHLIINDRDYSISKSEAALLKLYRSVDRDHQKHLLAVNENIVHMLKEED